MAKKESTDTEEIQAERGIPPLKAKRKSASTGMIIGVVFAGVILIALGIGTKVLLSHFHAERKTDQEKAQDKPARRSIGKGLDMSKVKPPPPPDHQQQSRKGTTPPDSDQHHNDGESPPAMTPQERKAAEQRAAEKRQRIADSAIMLATGSNTASAAASPTPRTRPQQNVNDALTAAALRAATQRPSTDHTSSKAATLSSSLKGVSTSNGDASLMLNPSMTLVKGSIIHCALQTPIDSTVPGFTKCTITNDVYSADGKVVLIERGSTAFGQYESASLKQGMHRIFVLWDRVDTVDHVVINLGSPATGPLGRAGVSGKINTHFWARFGAGLMLSLVDDVSSSLLARQQGTQTIQFSNTASEGQRAAQIALAHSVDIPPTLSTNQGALVNIIVARDVNFENVYALRSAD